MKDFFHVLRKFNTTADLLSRIGRTVSKQEIFYETCEVFTSSENSMFWEEIEDMQRINTEKTNEGENSTCFVITRSVQNISTDTVITNDADNFERSSDDYPELPTIIEEDAEFSESLRKMQENSKEMSLIGM